jgi:hypothetical protein
MLATAETMYADGHGEQDVTLNAEEYVPELQAVHGGSSVFLYPGVHKQPDIDVPPPESPLRELDGQSKQASDPCLSEYVPVGHMEQSPGPANGLYVPATHLVHSTPDNPWNPAGQMQSCNAVLAGVDIAWRGHDKQSSADVAATSDENVPAPHARQGRFPPVVLYVPAAQALHSVLLFILVYPRSQTQSSIVLLATESNVDVCSGQLLHAINPATSEYFPTGHSLHCPSPTTSLYVLGTHAVQSVPFNPV